MISPELAAQKAVCHIAMWRPLPDGSAHPRHYIQITGREVRQIVETGEFWLPMHLIPESVRAHREAVLADA